MDEEELLLGETGDVSISHDAIDEELLLGDGTGIPDIKEEIDEAAGSIGVGESVDHEELDYDEDEEKEERESKFTSERQKKSPIRAPEDEAGATTAPGAVVKKQNENAASNRGSYRGRGGYNNNYSGRGGRFNGGMNGPMGGMGMMRGGMRMMGGGGSAPISLLTSNIPPPMLLPNVNAVLGAGIGGKILVNPNFPGAGMGAGFPMMGVQGFGAPPMSGLLRGPVPNMPQPQQSLNPGAPKVTLSIDGAMPQTVVVNPRPPPQPLRPQQQQPMQTMTIGGPMNAPPPGMVSRVVVPNMMNGAGAPGMPPSAMRFPPGMAPPPMTITAPGMMAAPPPGMMNPAQGQNWNLMVEAFLGDKKSTGDSGRSRKKKRRRSRSSSYSSSGSESDYSSSSRSRSRSRSPRRSRKRDVRRHRKHKSSSGRAERPRGGERGQQGERRVFRGVQGGANGNNNGNGGAGGPPSLLTMRTSRRNVERERQREEDSRESARALGLDEDYLGKLEEQKRQRDEYRRKRERGGGDTRRDSSPRRGSGGNDDSRSDRKKAAPAADESKRKAYLAVHVRNIRGLGDSAMGRVKAIAGEIGETKKVWRSSDDVVTIIFVELDKAKAFMLKYNGKVLAGQRVAVGLEKMYLNLSEINSDR